MFEEFKKLSESFNNSGFELYLVGGSVRDYLLGIEPKDFDFTTNASSKEIEEIVKPFSKKINKVGDQFGTIGALIENNWIEITTYRNEIYREDSRKPVVTFSKSINEDLKRRDFTINSIAYDILNDVIVDPFNGTKDLKNKILRTPQAAIKSFSDDPLRMLRAARFISGLNLSVSSEILDAIENTKDRLEIVSSERIRDELCKLLVVEDPTAGLWFLVNTGLSSYFLPELDEMKMQQDPIHKHKDILAHTIAVVKNTKPELLVRLAALMHDIAKPTTRVISSKGVSFHHHEVVGAKMTRSRMKELHFSKEMIHNVSKLVYLHLRIHTFDAGWSDSAVRRYVKDAGNLLDELNHLQRCDCTTRNPRKAQELQDRMDRLEERILELKKQEELSNIKPDISGEEIMEILSITPGPIVGKAIKHLTEIRFDKGQLSKEEWKQELKAWAKTNL